MFSSNMSTIKVEVRAFCNVDPCLHAEGGLCFTGLAKNINDHLLTRQFYIQHLAIQNLAQ